MSIDYTGGFDLHMCVAVTFFSKKKKDCLQLFMGKAGFEVTLRAVTKSDL